MPSIYQDKTAIITGGSSGIGLSLARALAREGAHVWLLGRRLDRLETARQQVEAARQSTTQQVQVISADVSVPDQVEEAARQIRAAWGAPDYLINCAGVVHPGYVEKLSLQEYRLEMDINFYGTLHVVRAFLPAMLERSAGHIINFGSPASFLGVFGYSAYSASKYALRGYTDVLRSEVKPRGLRVSIVFPADTDTPQLAYDKAHQPPELQEMFKVWGATTVMDPDDVARITLRGIERGKYQIFPGFDGIVFYRLSSLLMGRTYVLVDWVLGRVMKRLAKGKNPQTVKTAGQ